jgi:hypothetical protein
LLLMPAMVQLIKWPSLIEYYLKRILTFSTL